MTLQVDEVALSSFEPVPSDWSLINLPPPRELFPARTRFTIPNFSPMIGSVPTTPTSPMEPAMELSDDKAWTGKDNIAITQIVAEQIIFATLDLLQETTLPDDDTTFNHRSESSIAVAILTAQQFVIKAVYVYIDDLIPSLVPRT